MKNIEKKNIRSLSLDDLMVFFIKNKEKKYRANQVYKWLWKRGVFNFSKMTDLSKKTVELLKNFFFINHSIIHSKIKSKDGTIKYLIKLYDGKLIESVLIPSKNRVTACISSQVGCSLDCNFCATASLNKERNLFFYEIYDQVNILNNQSLIIYNKSITNIVFMGMGEPLLNFSNLISSIDKISGKNELSISTKRITVSTVGIPKIIKKMADMKVNFNLAVSLHSAIQKKREMVMPFSNKIDLDELLESLIYWYDKLRKIITFEYIIWENINDNLEDIEELVKYCKKVPSKVNIIQYNYIGDKNYKSASNEVILNYQKHLNSNKIINTIRYSKGNDINAACGQLARRPFKFLIN
tara:strand:- start:480 stop:1541 length:1062 start_codon:yes stop_codon:yes gene_type:complete